MAIQVLNGIKITPRGNRFGPQNWPVGYAFGGWIYNIDCSIGFSKEPTTVTVKIALGNLGEVGGDDYSSKPITFDITKDDLYLITQAGVESLYDIEVDGKKFESFVMYSYDKDISQRDKVLTVIFKDYSVVLDKIYVGLVNRQGNKKVYPALATGVLPIKCPDCQFTGSSFVHSGELVRRLDLGSYVGMNGKIGDNFAPVISSLPLHGLNSNVYDFWSKLSDFAVQTTPVFSAPEDNFNLNGGYLIIGTEDMPQENCGSLPEVRYSLPELLWSTKLRGISYLGAFPTGYTTNTLFYKQNYVGTLREVLQNWCSDYALDFHVSGKSFIGMDVSKPIDILSITGILDPNTVTGDLVDFTRESAVSSYKESFSLDNTYAQSVITYNTRPASSTTKTKNIQKHVGYIPMHPIELNYNNGQQTIRRNAYGIDFLSSGHLYNWDTCVRGTRENVEINCPNGSKIKYVDVLSDRMDFRFAKWTNRTFGDIDVSMALAKFSPTIRDIYLGGRIIESLAYLDPSRNGGYVGMGTAAPVNNQEVKSSLDGHFKALGFHPLTRILDPALKTVVIEKMKSATQGNSLDATYFEVFLGYHYPEEKQGVYEWEKASAESMYRYGLLAQGIKDSAPYTVSDYFYNLSPDAGLSYGQKGIKRTTYSNEYEPDAKQYQSLKDAPFKDLVVYENRSNVPFYTGGYVTTRYTGAFIAEIDNIWGTSQETFDKELEFFDQRCQQYSTASVNEQLNDLDGTTKQTWDLQFFAPSFNDGVEELFQDFREVFESLAINTQAFGGASRLGVDQLSMQYFNYQGDRSQICQKLYFLLIPITQDYPNYPSHPNGKFIFGSPCNRTQNLAMLEKYKNEIIEERKRIQKEKVPSLCDVNIAEELCRQGVKASGNAAIAGRDPHNICDTNGSEAIKKYYCDPNPTGHYRVGFHPSYISGARNSRFIDVTIVRNPFGLNPIDAIVPTDDNGNYYLDDLNDPNSLMKIYQPASRTARIVYPISTPFGYGYRGTYEDSGQMYYGLMKTNVETETRQPKTVEIYGEPFSGWNPAASIKVINNEISPDLDPFLNGDNNQFLIYTSLISGSNTQAVVTISGYHSVISGLNSYQSTGASQSIDLSIAGPPNNLAGILNPSAGLTSFSISIGNGGVSTQLSFKSKPPTLASQETILNKITARLKK